MMVENARNVVFTLGICSFVLPMLIWYQSTGIGTSTDTSISTSLVYRQVSFIVNNSGVSFTLVYTITIFTTVKWEHLFFCFAAWVPPDAREPQGGMEAIVSSRTDIDQIIVLLINSSLVLVTHSKLLEYIQPKNEWFSSFPDLNMQALLTMYTSYPNPHKKLAFCDE